MAKRRASKDGTIYQLPSGHWRGQVSIDGRRMSHTAPTQAEIRRWIKEITGQIEAGLTYDAAQTMLNEFLTGWLAQKKTALRTATYQQYDWLAKTHIIPELGKFKLQEITPARVQKFYDDMLTRGVGVRAIRVTHGVLHGCMNHAARLGLMARNPCAVCILPKQENKEMAVWTESHVSQFLITVKGHRNEILYHLALATGMRRGELLGLKWSDIDWLARTLKVQRQVCQPNEGGWKFQEPKSDRGKRSIELGKGMLERLREQEKKINLERRAIGERWKENDLIFPSSVGTPQGGSRLTNEFLKLAHDAGLPRIRFHDCRHTAASIMLSHGVPPVIVAGILGHSLAMLMDKYAHFIPSSQGIVAKLMDELMPVDVTQKS
jgi:integrase